MALGALPIAATALKTGVGLFQTLRGIFTPKPERPVMGVNPATTEMVSRARSKANATSDSILTSERADIDRSVGSAYGTLRKSVSNTGELLTGLAGIEANKGRAINQAFGSYGSRQLSYENNLLRSYDVIRADQRDAFEWNKIGKYNEESSRRENMIASGLQNIGVGASEAGTLGIYNNILGGMGGQTGVGGDTAAMPQNPFRQLSFLNRMPTYGDMRR